MEKNIMKDNFDKICKRIDEFFNKYDWIKDSLQAVPFMCYIKTNVCKRLLDYIDAVNNLLRYGN